MRVAFLHSESPFPSLDDIWAARLIYKLKFIQMQSNMVQRRSYWLFIYVVWCECELFVSYEDNLILCWLIYSVNIDD